VLPQLVTNPDISYVFWKTVFFGSSARVRRGKVENLSGKFTPYDREGGIGGFSTLANRF
jgi:hypothetical protein